MIPRFSVTSLTRARPASFRGLFCFSLPFRYSMTSTLMEIPRHSSNPASGPSVSPVPRSTRKLNCAYGRSRKTAMSSSRRVADVLQPDQVVEAQLDLLVRDVVAHGIEGGHRPAARPRARQSPRIDGVSTRRGQLTDGDVPAIVVAGDDQPAPVVEFS